MPAMTDCLIVPLLQRLELHRRARGARAGRATTIWYMWKLPLFGERDVTVIASELIASRTALPGDPVRLVGYDSKRQSQGPGTVVFRGSA